MAPAQTDFQTAYTLINDAQRILIVAHQKPDGDTSGSTLSLFHWLSSLGKSPQIYCKDPFPDDYLFMPGATMMTTDTSVFHKSWDLLISCDSGDLTYAGVAEYVHSSLQGVPIINIDHHASNTFFGTVDLVDIDASSTAEVLYSFYEVNGVEITKAMAICLMTAIFYDTGGFSNEATNHKALLIASNLVNQGASIEQIHRAIVANKNLEVMKLWGRVLSRIQEQQHGIMTSYILQEDLKEFGLDDEAVRGISNYLMQMRDARAIVIFHETDDGSIKASMRTLQDSIDLSKLAKICGGGGHKKASGFTVPGRFIKSLNGLMVVPSTD